MIRETIPSTATQGEKVLFEVFRDRLPDDFIVWYEPTVNKTEYEPYKYYPDFVVFGPDFGLLILEVKGWYASQVAKASHSSFELKWTRNRHTKLEPFPNPLHQGRGYFEKLANQLSSYSNLCNPEGDYKGKLLLPEWGRRRYEQHDRRPGST